MEWVVAGAIGKPILEGLLKLGGRRIDVAIRGTEAERGVAEAMRAAIPAAVRATMPEGNAEPTEEQLAFVGTVIEEALTRESLGSALLLFDFEALRDQTIEREWRRLLTERLNPLNEPAFGKEPSWAAMEGLDLAVLYEHLVTHFLTELRARRARQSLQGLVDELDSGQIQRQLREILAQLRIQDDERYRQREAVLGLKQELIESWRKEVFSRDWTRYGSEWIEIPTFHFASGTRLRDAQHAKEIVRAFLRIFALGLQMHIPRTVNVVQFVALLHLGVEDEGMSFDLLCPFPELIGFLNDHTPPRSSQQEFDAVWKRRQLEIHNKSVIVDNLTLPLVVDYQPLLRRVSLVNQNHWANPAQFLNPNLCRKTSGFLNFLGALSIASRVSKGGPLIHFADFDKLEMNGLEQWFRWLYYVLDTGHGLDSKRLYVGSHDPEQYHYDYSGLERGAPPSGSFPLIEL